MDQCVDGSDMVFSATPVPGTVAGDSGEYTPLTGLVDNGDGTATLDVDVAVPGTYTIEYTYSDDNGCPAVATTEVTVYGLPIVDAGIDASICEGDTTMLDGRVEVGYANGNFQLINSTLDESFGGPESLFNDIDDTGPQTIHVRREMAGQDWGIAYSLDGTYEIEAISLDRRNDCCTKRGHGGVIQILNGGVVVYESDVVTAPGNGELFASPAIANLSGDEVRYIFKNGVDTEVADLLNFAELNIYLGDTNQGLSYEWSPATGLSDPTVADPLAFPTTTTTYTLTVTNEHGCTATDEVSISIIGSQEVNSVESINPTCGLDNGSITFSFDPNPTMTHMEFSLDGGLTWSGNISVNAGTWTATDLAAGLYDLMIRRGNDLCPVDLEDLTLIDQPGPLVNAGVDQEICDGDQALINATIADGTEPLTYAWAGPDGYTASSEDISTSVEGTFTLTVTDANGCIGTDEIEIKILDLDGGEIATPIMSCPGNDPELITSITDPSACDGPDCVEPAIDYTWECRESDGAGGWTAWTLIAGADMATYDPPVQNLTKQYRRLASVQGCDGFYASNEVVVEVCPCEVNAGADMDLCVGGSLGLSANATGIGALSYAWSPAGTLDDPTSATPTATPDGTTTYTVTVTDEIGCQVTDEVIITQLDSTVIFCQRYRIRDEEDVWGNWTNFENGDCTIELCEMNGLQDIQFDGGPNVNSGWVWTDESGNIDSEVDEIVVFANIDSNDAGTYTGTLTNGNGCVSVVNFEVIVNKSVEATVLATIMDYCHDGSGEALITVSEGMGPYTINWQSQDGSETGTTTISDPGDYTLSGLNGGTTYCIEVIDAKGCEIAP